MAKHSKSYNFNEAATAAIVANGFTIKGVKPGDFAHYIHSNFPGFDLNQFITDIEAIIKVCIESRPLTKTISIESERLRVRIENDYTCEDDALIFDRLFYKEHDQITVSHEYFVIPETYRNKGIGKQVLKASLQHYRKFDVSKVEVVAGLSKGAYVWARHGFLGIHSVEMERILKKAEIMLSAKEFGYVKKIYDAYYGKYPAGESFPVYQWAAFPCMKKVLMNPESQWTGRLDLKNTEQLSKFEKYVNS